MEYEGLTREELVERLEKAEEALRDLDARRKQSRGNYEQSCIQGADSYDSAPVPLCTLDRKGVVLAINRAGAMMFGREKADIVGKPLVALGRFSDESAVSAHLDRCRDARDPVVSELHLSSDGVLLAISTANEPRRGSDAIYATALIDSSTLLKDRFAGAQARSAEVALRRRLESIDGVGLAIGRTLASGVETNLDDLLRVLIEGARAISGADFAAVGIEHNSAHPGRGFARWITSEGDTQARERAPATGQRHHEISDASGPIHVSDVLRNTGATRLTAAPPDIRGLIELPLRYENLRFGTLFVGNRAGGAELTEEARITLRLLAGRAGIALRVFELHGIEAAHRRRLKFLAEAGPTFAGSLDHRTAVDAIGRLVVPELADFCVIRFRQPNGALKISSGRHVIPEKEALLSRLTESLDLNVASEITREAFDTQRAKMGKFNADSSERSFDPSLDREIFREIGLTEFLIAPLVVREEVRGLLYLGMSEPGRTFSQEDVPLAEFVARYAASIIENARLYEVAQEAIGARDNVLAIVSHDLRSPLAAIGLSADFLERMAGTDGITSGQRQVTIIKSAVARMKQLIEALRDASMIDVGRFTVTRRAENVGALLREAFDTLEPLAQARSIELTAHVPPGLPALSCDAERTIQVVMNLVGNAIKFTPEGGSVKVSARAVDDEVEFSVSDSGPGISESQLPRLFERYWKGRWNNRQGTGLGLFIAKGIVEAHHGRIWVETEVDRGSTFYFTLPVEPTGGEHASVRDPRMEAEPAT